MSSTQCTLSVILTLLVLVLQNSMLVVMTRYSRTNVPPELRYHSSTLILNQEIMKFFFCIILLSTENRFVSRPLLDIRKTSTVPPGLLTLIWRVIFQREALKMSVPAVLFTLQNYLIFLSLSNLDAVSFQVLSQTKLISAAVFSVVMLGRRLSMMQWTSLFALTLGVLLTLQQPPSEQKNSGVVNEPAQPPQRLLLGVAACVLSGILSSYASVYFEMVVKTTAESLVVRNIHLSLFGIPFSAFSLLLLDVLPQEQESDAVEFRYWRGYSQWLTIALVAVHAFGGLLVAVVVKRTDNVVKGFATGFAVIFSGILSFFIWGHTPSESFAFGSLLIVVSAAVYHRFEVHIEPH